MADDGLIRFGYEVDDQGRTVLRPLTGDDREFMEDALKNPKGLRFGETMQEAQECLVEPDVPYGLSPCGIAAEQDEARRTARTLAREQWDVGNEGLAVALLDILDASETQ